MAAGVSFSHSVLFVGFIRLKTSYYKVRVFKMIIVPPGVCSVSSASSSALATTYTASEERVTAALF